MTSRGPPPSNFPTSMGPGARPLNRETPQANTNWKAFNDAREQYTLTGDGAGLRIGYELKGVRRNYSVPYENMPLGGLSQWVLYGGQSRANITGLFVIDTIRGMENISGNWLTQSQVEGVALHSSKRMLYSYSSAVVALIGGGYMAFRGRKDMKFPFMNPRAPERYTNFPNRYIPILRGQFARTMWQITRLNVWLALGLLFINPIFNSMGAASMMAGLYRDDRTKELVKGMRGSLNRVGSNTPQASSAKSSAPPADSDGANTMSGFSAIEADSSAVEGLDSHCFRYGAHAGLDDATDYGRQLPKDPEPQPSAYSRTQSSESGGANALARSDFFFDDASPTAGNDPSMSSPGPHQISGSGSVWERVRRNGGGQGVPQTQTQSPRTQQRSPSRLQNQQMGSNATKDGDFSFSSSDEEKQLARQQAQREFDDMLERERRESGSSEYASGMYAAQKGQEQPGGDGSGSAWERRRRN